MQGIKTPNNKLFKVRLANPDAQKGERGDFRVIYYLLTCLGEIYLLTIYSKSDQSDISRKELLDIIKPYINGPGDSK